MQNKMIETPGTKIRENFGKSKRPGGGGWRSNSADRPVIIFEMGESGG